MLAGGLVVVVDPGGHNEYVAARFVVAAVVVTVGVVAAARARTLANPGALALAWLALGIVALAAALLGPDPLLSLLGNPARLAGVVSLPLIFGAFMLGASTGPDGITTIQTASAVGLAAVSGVGLLQLAGLVSRSADRIDGTLGNAGFLGAYLCLVLPLAVSLFAARRGRLRVGLAVVLATAVVVTVASGTRGAWIGAAAGLAAFGALLLWRRGALRPWRMAGIAAAGLVVVVVALIAPVNRGTMRGRVDIWANAVPVLTARPVLGWGPESFRTGFERSVSKDWVRRYGLEQLPDRAHNRFLDVAATGGVLGTAADVTLLALIALAGRRALRATRDDPARWYAVAGVLAGLVGWLVQGLFLFDTFDLSLLWWLLAGTVVAVVPSRTASGRARWLLPATMAGVVAVGALGFVADRRAEAALHSPTPIQAVRRLASVAHLRPRQLDIYLLAGTIAIRSGDVATLRRAHALLDEWRDPDIRLSDAEVLARLGAIERDPAALAQSASTYQAVLGVQPNNGLAWLGLGETLVRIGDAGAAATALESALSLLPRSPYPSLDLGLLALARGDLPTACRLARTAAKIAPKSGQPRDLQARVTRAGFACS